MPKNREKHFIKGVKMKFVKDESGVSAVLFALILPLLLGMAGLAVDLGHMIVVKNELGKAAEAGALAGARGLWPSNLQTAGERLPNPTSASIAGLKAVEANSADGKLLTDNQITVEVGSYDFPTSKFTLGGNIPDLNSVRVTTKAKVTMFFMGALGILSEDMSATATAVMGATCVLKKDPLPFAVNDKYIAVGTVIRIYFKSAVNDNGGWFAKDAPASSNTIKDYIENNSCPEIATGDTLNIMNGELDSTFKPLRDLIGNGLDTYVPVVNTDQFNQTEKVDSFVHLHVDSVVKGGGPDGKYIEATILPMGMVDGRPGGKNNDGVLSQPKLVG